MKEPFIELKHSMGFAGTSYYIKLRFDLSDMTLGSKQDEENARKKAVELLRKLGIEIDISEKPFTWDGTL